MLLSEGLPRKLECSSVVPDYNRFSGDFDLVDCRNTVRQIMTLREDKFKNLEGFTLLQPDGFGMVLRPARRDWEKMGDDQIRIPLHSEDQNGILWPPNN